MMNIYIHNISYNLSQWHNRVSSSALGILTRLVFTCLLYSNYLHFSAFLRKKCFFVKISLYENCEMAIAISSSLAASASVPRVAFKCLNQGQCSDWMEAFKL